MNEDGLLSVKELSSYLKVSPCTLYRLVESKEIPFIRRSGLGIRFRKEEVDEWLARQSSKPNALIETALKTDFALERYDRIFLKGGKKMSPKGKIWNYPFGSVYFRQTKSGQGRWYVYYRDEGKRVRKAVRGAQSRADALKVLQVEVADAFRGKHGFKRDEKRIKFADFCQLYIESYAKLHKRSWRDDVSAVNIFKHHFGNIYLHELAALAIEDFQSVRRRERVSNARINRNLTILKRMLTLAVDWGYLKENPASKIKRLREEGSTEMRILGRDEKKALLEACVPHLRPILLTALLTPGCVGVRYWVCSGDR